MKISFPDYSAVEDAFKKGYGTLKQLPAQGAEKVEHVVKKGVDMLLQVTPQRAAAVTVLLAALVLIASLFVAYQYKLLNRYYILFTIIYGGGLFWIFRGGVEKDRKLIRFFGLASILSLGWLGCWAIAIRMQAEFPKVATGFVVGVAIWSGFVFLVLRREKDFYRLCLRAGIIGIPLLAGWVTSSAVHLITVNAGFAPYERERAEMRIDAGVQATFAARKERAKANPDVVVAVALSGGGYRAAAIHAGVLRALDRMGIPIHYLSSVSGGSIIGAFYSLGYTPEQFQTLLSSRVPGLPNYIAETDNYLQEWLIPSYRNSDTYASHLSRAYFGNHTLSEMGGRDRMPVPLINVTEFETARRWVFAPATEESVFPCMEHPRGHVFDSIPVSHAVAASGAFPGAFEPVRIASLPAHQFSDGGMAENLGLAGLREYFAMLPRDKPRPTVVIISDASMEKQDKEPPPKWFIASMLTIAANSGFESYHNQLYSDYTNGDYRAWSESYPRTVTKFHTTQERAFGLRDPKNRWIGARMVDTIILDATHPSEMLALTKDLSSTDYEIPRLDGSGNESIEVTKESVEAVPRIPTLREISASEVAAAGWLGEKVVEQYGPAIANAMLHARAEAEESRKKGYRPAQISRR